MLDENPQQKIGESKIAELCPYCKSKNFVRRGTRKNQYQVVQLYLCKNEECARTFTAQDVKGKHFPLNVVIEAMSYYNWKIYRKSYKNVPFREILETF